MAEAAPGRVAAALAALVFLLLPATVRALPADQPVFTDFEGLTTSVGVAFEIGPSGSRARFSGTSAWAPNVGGSALSGTQAWVVENAADVGTITFVDTPATVVEFYATPGTNPFGMVIRAFDPSDALIGSPVVLSSGTGWTLVTFAGPVGRITVTNDAAGDRVYIDDFGFATGGGPTVPLLGGPGIVALVLAAVLGGWLILRRRQPA